MSIHSEGHAPAPEATREADDWRGPLAGLVLYLGLDGKQHHAIKRLIEASIEANYVAERAAQARENETLRADNQRLALRVKTLLAGRATAMKRDEGLSADIESLQRWGMVSRDGEAPELDVSPRGTFLSRSDVLRALAARAPEATP